MARAVIHGKEGTATWTAGVSINASIVSWVAEITGDTASSTSTNDKRFVQRLPTWKSWTATVTMDGNDSAWTDSALLTDADPVVAGIGATASLVLGDGTSTYTGNAICNGFNKNVDMNEIVQFTWSFQGTGALTLA